MPHFAKSWRDALRNSRGRQVIVHALQRSLDRGAAIGEFGSKPAGGDQRFNQGFRDFDRHDQPPGALPRSVSPGAVGSGGHGSPNSASAQVGLGPS